MKATEDISLRNSWELQEGEQIVVEGDKTKRGVIRASRVSFSREG